MRGGDLVTERLSLIAMTPESVAAEKAGDGRLGEVIGATVPAGVASGALGAACVRLAGGAVCGGCWMRGVEPVCGAAG